MKFLLLSILLAPYFTGFSDSLLIKTESLLYEAESNSKVHKYESIMIDAYDSQENCETEAKYLNTVDLMGIKYYYFCETYQYKD